LKSTIGVSVLQHFDAIIPIREIEDAVDIVTALAAFTAETDPWTTKLAFEKASCILDAYESHLRSKNGALAILLENILKQNVKPLFSKARNPAITSAGRKNVHPVPLPRFDSSLFDDKSKPWKFKDAYSITVLTWIINRYLVCSPFTLPGVLFLFQPLHAVTRGI
jgi:hypothetical protein